MKEEGTKEDDDNDDDDDYEEREKERTMPEIRESVASRAPERAGRPDRAGPPRAREYSLSIRSDVVPQYRATGHRIRTVYRADTRVDHETDASGLRSVQGHGFNVDRVSLAARFSSILNP
ncbi:hypothetical protein HN011_011599 [Eciton burchellii]|nr:hypothetical protein HN011_011599 [Eciton burchellii]